MTVNRPSEYSDLVRDEESEGEADPSRSQKLLAPHHAVVHVIPTYFVFE